MFRAWVKDLIRGNIGRLPWGLRQAILEGLIRRDGATGRLMQLICDSGGIVAVVADGEFGRFASVPNDHEVLGRYARTGTYSRIHNRFFERFFGATAGTYLDIGANIGLTTVPIARNPKIKCICFEAEPSNFANLRDNVARNCPHGNVELHPIALFDRRGMVRLGLDSGKNPGDHRIVSGDSTRKAIDVDAAPLDELAGDIRGPLAVKMDVQGAEPFVLAGGARTMAKAGALAMEFSPPHIHLLGADCERVLDVLSGFRSIAILAAESNQEPVFGDTNSALESLRAYHGRHKTADPDRQFYVEVFALR